MLKRIMVFILFLVGSCAISAAQSQVSETPLAMAKAWWNAVTFGDTAFVKQHSTDGLSVTFSSGRSFNKSEMVAQVATHNSAARITVQWSGELVQVTAPQTAIVTNSVVETVGVMQNNYKFITVLVNNNSQWKVAAAQSTRIIEIAPTITAAEAGNLQDYVGSYKTQAGTFLKISARDTILVLTEPSGLETTLSAIAPGLFEIPKILSAGNVRFAFSRDATGNVTAMIRIAHKIITMPRMK